jgi:hypothetical protein
LVRNRTGGHARQNRTSGPYLAAINRILQCGMGRPGAAAAGRQAGRRACAWYEVAATADVYLSVCCGNVPLSIARCQVETLELYLISDAACEDGMGDSDNDDTEGEAAAPTTAAHSQLPGCASTAGQPRSGYLHGPAQRRCHHWNKDPLCGCQIDSKRPVLPAICSWRARGDVEAMNI